MKRKPITPEEIVQLPEDVWKEILTYLSFGDKVCRFSLTSRANYSLTVANIRVVGRTYLRSPFFKDYQLSRFYNLTELDLRYSMYFSSDVLSNFSRLQKLYLSFNKTITDSTLKNLTTLTSLSLSNNNTISNDGLLPLQNNLIYLNLACNNRIDSISELTSLTHLNISHNKSIGDYNLLSLTNLTFLDALSNINVHQSLPLLTSLKRIRLGNNSTDRVRDHHLSPLTSLETLVLRGNMEITGSCLFQLTQLTSLDITGTCNNFMFENISCLTNLTSLQIPLCDSHLSNEGVGKLTNLTNLHLGLSTSCVITFETIQSMKKLKRLHLSGNRNELKERIDEFCMKV